MFCVLLTQVQADWPVIEDPANYAYIRPEGAGLMVGLFEAQAAAWNVEGIPNDFSFGSIRFDLRVHIFFITTLPPGGHTMKKDESNTLCTSSFVDFYY